VIAYSKLNFISLHQSESEQFISLASTLFASRQDMKPGTVFLLVQGAVRLPVMSSLKHLLHNSIVFSFALDFDLPVDFFDTLPPVEFIRVHELDIG